MAYLQAAGPNTILSSSSTGPGPWVRVHPSVRNVTFQATHTGSSVGTSVASTSFVEVSNDGVNPLNTKAATIVMGTAPLDVSPAVDGFSIDAHYEWVRGNINSISTGTIAIIASVHDRK